MLLNISKCKAMHACYNNNTYIYAMGSNALKRTLNEK